jgi:phosphoglycolate phosphatase
MHNNINNPNLKHIIWDWNGTLLNDVEFCKNIINRILKENNLEELTLNRYREIFTFPVQKYYEAAGLDFSKTSFEILGKDFMIEYEANKLKCNLFDGTKELLKKIKQKGIRQSILSAYKEDNLIDILKSYELTDFFDFVVGSDNIYAGGKIHLGLQLLEKLNHKGDEVLFVGDTLHDYDVAKAMGVNVVLIADGHQAKEKLSINGALVLDNIRELEKYLFPA